MLVNRARNILWESVLGWMPRLKLRIKVTARSNRCSFVLELLLVFFYITMCALLIILIVLSMLKTKIQGQPLGSPVYDILVTLLLSHSMTWVTCGT